MRAGRLVSGCDRVKVGHVFIAFNSVSLKPEGLGDGGGRDTATPVRDSDLDSISRAVKAKL